MIRMFVLVIMLVVWTTVAPAATCSGTAIPAPPSVLKPPAVPQPRNGNDIVGLNVQNTGSTALGPHYITTAQFFKRAQVQPTTALVAWINGTKLGSLTFMLSAMCANASVPVLLSKASGSDPILTGQLPLSLTTASFTLTADLTFTGGQYSGLRSVNLAVVAKKDLTDPIRQDYWLRGPLDGRWVTPFNDPQVWMDGRASVSIANQPDFNGTGWTWDTAHKPNLAYVP